MSFKSLVRDLRDIKESIGSMSRRRTFDAKLHHSRVRSQSILPDLLHTSSPDAFSHHQKWANLPPEILRDVLQRVESSEGSWPARKDVVACSAVCKGWREITKELVKTPEQSGMLTFPISLKQPGPRDLPMQCFIKRDRTNSTYYLYLGLSPSLVVENSKFLLAARKFRRATSTDYIISLNADDMSRGSKTYVGKLRSNFLGTKFTIYDSQPPHNGAVVSTSRGSRRIGSKQVSPKVPAGSYSVAHIAYELNVLGTRGPRRMQCTLHSIPASAMEAGGTAPTPMELPSFLDESFSSISFSKQLGISTDFSNISFDSVSKVENKSTPLILKNKAPRWHEQLQCWCLNFRGRVTVASVKNFQLVASIEPNQTIPQSEQDKVLLQFGKIGKDIFTMDYRYPLSAFQAFAICLSSFDTKLACE